jgi:hypothetical protein
MVHKIRAAHPTLLAALAIAGCGGGDGGSNPAPQQNLQSATWPSQPMTIPSTTLTATDSSGSTYTITYSSTPGAMATFNGQTASTSMIALTVSENGAVVATEDSTAYYLADPYSPFGSLRDNQRCCVDCGHDRRLQPGIDHVSYAVTSDGTVQALVQAQLTVNGTILSFH